MGHMISWDDQRAFLAVLEEGSLSAAARRIGVTQPTMRARVEALERALDTTLFTRSFHGLVPTEQARALGDSVRAMARASEAFVRAASAEPGQVAGTVRLSVSEFVGVEVLPAMLAPLVERYPRLRVEIVLSNAAADLIEQEVDVAVRMHQPVQEQLIARKIGAIPLGLFAHPDYLKRRGSPESVNDLPGHDFIASDRVRAELQLASSIHPGLTKKDFVVRTDSHPAQLAAARAGLGIAVVQRPVGLADPLLRPVLPDLIVAELETWIVAHENLRTVPRVAAVYDHLVQAFTAFIRTGTAPS